MHRLAYQHIHLTLSRISYIYVCIYITLGNEIVTTNETLFDQECSEQQGLDLDENCFDDAGKAYSVIDVLHYIPKVISSHPYQAKSSIFFV